MHAQRLYLCSDKAYGRYMECHEQMTQPILDTKRKWKTLKTKTTLNKQSIEEKSALFSQTEIFCPLRFTSTRDNHQYRQHKIRRKTPTPNDTVKHTRIIAVERLIKIYQVLRIHQALLLHLFSSYMSRFVNKMSL